MGLSGSWRARLARCLLLLMVSLTAVGPVMQQSAGTAEALSHAPNVRPGVSTGGTPLVSQITGSSLSLNDLNAGWVRVEAHWVDIETSNGVFNFNSLDAAIAAAQSQSPRQILAVIRDNPPIAAASRCKITTATERTRLAQFTTALVQRYGSALGNLEFYNEPDNVDPDLGVILGGCFGTVNGTTPTQQGRDDYALMIESAAAAARAANPNIKIFFGGLASSNYIGPAGAPAPFGPTNKFDRDFLRGALSKLKNDGRINLIDAVSVHYFSEQTVFWSTPGNPDLLGRIAGLRNDMAQAGLFGSELKPVFVEESSFTECLIGVTCTAPVFSILQRNYVPKVLSRAFAGEVFGYLWFQLRDQSGGGLGGENTYGLLDSNGVAKPSYAAFKFFNSLVDGPTRFVGRAAVGSPKLEGYEFATADGRRFQIVWNQTDGEQIPYAPAGGTITSITDPTGAGVGAVNGRASVGPDPVYIFFNAACSPRPNVGVTTQPIPGGHLGVTLTAGRAGVPNNTIHSVQVDASSNVTVDSAAGVGQGGKFTVNLSPPAQTTSLTVNRVASGNALVRLVITDDCGDWPTFVGGGGGGGF